MQAYQRNAQVPQKRFFERRNFLIGLFGLGTVASLGGAGAVWNYIRYFQSSTIYRGHSRNVASITWSPDSKSLASLDRGGEMRIWESFTGTTLLSYQIRNQDSEFWTFLAWSPNKKYIAATSDNASIHIWNTATNSVSFTYKGHLGAQGIEVIQWSPNSELLASRDEDGHLHVWSPHTGKRISTINGESTYGPTIVWSPDSRQIAINGISSAPTVIYSIETNLTVLTLEDAGSMAWSPDGKQLIIIHSSTPGSGGGGMLKVASYDIKTGKKVLTSPTYESNGMDDSWIWSANGEDIIFTDTDRLKSWNIKKGGNIRHSSLVFFGYPEAMSFSPDGKYLAGRYGKEIHIWDVSAITFEKDSTQYMMVPGKWTS